MFRLLQQAYPNIETIGGFRTTGVRLRKPQELKASLRRIAHFDYWSENVRRSVLADSKADLLVYGNAERQIGAIAQRLNAGEAIGDITDVRGTAYLRRGMPAGWVEIDSSELDAPGPLNPPVDPYASEEQRLAANSGAAPVNAAPAAAPVAGAAEKVVKFYRKVPNAQRERSVIVRQAPRLGRSLARRLRSCPTPPQRGTRRRRLAAGR